MFDINKTYEYLMAVAELTPPTTFLRDRYFPTGASDIFNSSKVLAEYKSGSKKLAPVVAPRKGGVAVLRAGSQMKEYEPPMIAPKRTTSYDDIIERGFGEAILPTLTPAERESQLALADAKELDELITRREEMMCAELLQKNGYVLKQIADGLDTGDEYEIFFYDGSDNPSLYTASEEWTAAGADILGDLYQMILLLTARGLPATDLIVGTEVADAIINNKAIYDKLLVPDGKLNIGKIDPATLPDGAALIATLNVKGRNISILCYDETYEADDGANTPFIAPGTAILTAPKCGKTLYGAVTQIEQKDREFHTYAARRVPKTWVGENVKEVTLAAKPLPMPINETPWITATVL